MSLARTFSKAFINNGLSPAGPERAIGSLNEGETFLAVMSLTSTSVCRQTMKSSGRPEKRWRDRTESRSRR